MLEGGVEPPQDFSYRILNPARLPIPPPEPVPRCTHAGRSGAEGGRTPDLLNAIQALSQLSYGPDVVTRLFNQRSCAFTISSGADGTRTRGLRCDRPAL
jgi:hypothetical protein